MVPQKDRGVTLEVLCVDKILRLRVRKHIGIDGCRGLIQCQGAQPVTAGVMIVFHDARVKRRAVLDVIEQLAIEQFLDETRPKAGVVLWRTGRRVRPPDSCLVRLPPLCSPVATSRIL